MKLKSKITRHLALVSAIAFNASAYAANLTWDTVTGDGAAITAGGGNWDTSTVTWGNAAALPQVTVEVSQFPPPAVMAA
ncbi:MAG: hypothetical protein RLZZ245_3105, partial [Verrucomicrobiota bacterium]